MALYCIGVAGLLLLPLAAKRIDFDENALLVGSSETRIRLVSVHPSELHIGLASVYPSAARSTGPCVGCRDHLDQTSAMPSMRG
jgi:hypothetical protein